MPFSMIIIAGAIWPPRRMSRAGAALASIFVSCLVRRRADAAPLVTGPAAYYCFWPYAQKDATPPLSMSESRAALHYEHAVPRRTFIQGRSGRRTCCIDDAISPITFCAQQCSRHRLLLQSRSAEYHSTRYSSFTLLSDLAAASSSFHYGF